VIKCFKGANAVNLGSIQIKGSNFYTISENLIGYWPIAKHVSHPFFKIFIIILQLIKTCWRRTNPFLIAMTVIAVRIIVELIMASPSLPSVLSSASTLIPTFLLLFLHLFDDTSEFNTFFSSNPEGVIFDIGVDRFDLA